MPAPAAPREQESRYTKGAVIRRQKRSGFGAEPSHRHSHLGRRRWLQRWSRAEIEIVEFGEDVVMWVLDLAIEKVWANRDWQADRFLRYASLRRWSCESGRGREVGGPVPSTGQSRKWMVSSGWRDGRRSTLHASHSIAGRAWNVPCVESGFACANASESVRAARAGRFRSGVGVASAGSVLVLRRLVWCAKRKKFRHVTRHSRWRWLVGFACAHD